MSSFHVLSAVVADGLAELRIGWPNVPAVFCETRQLAEPASRSTRIEELTVKPLALNTFESP